MDKEISIWYDEEGDFLEVTFEKRKDSTKKQTMMPSWKK